MAHLGFEQKQMRCRGHNVQKQPLAQSTSLLRKALHKIIPSRASSQMEIPMILDTFMTLPSADSLRTSLLLPKLSAQFVILKDPDETCFKASPAVVARNSPKTSHRSLQNDKRTSKLISTESHGHFRTRSILSPNRCYPQNPLPNIPCTKQRSSVRIPKPAKRRSRMCSSSSDTNLRSTIGVPRDYDPTPQSCNLASVVNTIRTTKTPKSSNLHDFTPEKPESMLSKVSSTALLTASSAEHGNGLISCHNRTARLPFRTKNPQYVRLYTQSHVGQRSAIGLVDSVVQKLDPCIENCNTNSLAKAITYDTIHATADSIITRKEVLRKNHRSAKLYGASKLQKISLLSQTNPIWLDALQNDDFGKATAMGLFNKPVSAYNEEEFIQRQLHLHRDRVNESTPSALKANPSTMNGVTSNGGWATRILKDGQEILSHDI